MSNQLSPADSHASEVRIEQTRQEIDILQSDVTELIQQRRNKDRQQQYSTQLNVLEKALKDSVAMLGTELGKLSTSLPPELGSVYTCCREYDEGLLLVRRVLSYYLSKYDQRDDPKLAAVLATADDVVWSCYAGVFENRKNTGVVRGTVPLTYIESQYSPQAVLRAVPPSDLLPGANDLAAYLMQLPIPVIGLPPVCIREPWWLIYIGHEVGHHLQYDLFPPQGRADPAKLVNGFDDLLRTTLRNTPDVSGAAGRWLQWSKELFADLCSICSMGPWAAHALIELALSNERDMLSNESDRKYPPFVVRLEFLAQITKQLDLTTQDALGSLDPSAIISRAKQSQSPVSNLELVEIDKGLAEKVAAAALEYPLNGIGTFKELYDWQAADFGNGGSVVRWTEALRGRSGSTKDITFPAARKIISGAVAAWYEVAAIEDAAARQTGRQQLAAKVLETVQANHMPGTRAAARTTDVTGLGEQLMRAALNQFEARTGSSAVSSVSGLGEQPN